MHAPDLFHHDSMRDQMTIAPGTIADLHALARFHYRAGRPATVCGLWSATMRVPANSDRYATREGGTRTLGVLVVSMPVLNCRGRRAAWPGRFEGDDRSAIAERVNAQVRTISRVIIDPRVRGIGLASRLVRHALDHASTPLMEAMATMGDACGFFERAGMQRVAVSRAPDDARLATKLKRLQIDPAELLSPGRCRDVLKQAAPHKRETLLRAARTWRLASGIRKRKTRDVADDPPRLLATAARQLVYRPVYYAYEQSSDSDRIASAS